MPDLFRVTTSFAGRKQGWSESIVYPALPTTTPGAFHAAVGLPIAQKRVELLGREYTLDAVRVAKIRNDAGAALKRNVLLFTVDLKPALQNAANGAEQPNACAVVQAVDAAGSRKKNMFLGGIPDEIAVDGGEFFGAGAGGWISRFNAWTALVVAAQGGWLEDIVNLGPVNMTGYVINANKTLQFSFEAPLFQVGEIGEVRTIRVKGVNNGSVVNGTQEVIVGTETTCTTVKALAVFPYSFGGAATSYVRPKPFISAVAWAVDVIRTRKRGRPSYATRGRVAARQRG